MLPRATSPRVKSELPAVRTWMVRKIRSFVVSGLGKPPCTVKVGVLPGWMAAR